MDDDSLVFCVDALIDNPLDKAGNGEIKDYQADEQEERQEGRLPVGFDKRRKLQQRFH